METLVALQRWIYGTITTDLSAFASTRSWLALLSILPFGVLFGSIHALTPGHGKSILAAYVVGSDMRAFRGAAMATTLALTHVATAVVIALVANFLITRTLGGAGRAPLLETTSRILLVLAGVVLIVRAIRTRQPHSHSRGILVGAMAGLVPCPLTLFVMFFAMSRGIPDAGVAFAFAMMLGIAITLCGVAIASVLARGALLKVFVRYSDTLPSLERYSGIVSGVLLVAIGAWDLVT